MVLDGVVRAALKDLGDLGPLIPVVPVHQVQYPFLFLGPADLLDLRVQVIMPALPALLSDAAWQVFSHESPLLRAVLVNEMKYHAILFLSPRALDQTRIEYFLPSVKALNVSAARKLLGNPFPVFTTMLSYSFCQMLILKGMVSDFIRVFCLGGHEVRK